MNDLDPQSQILKTATTATFSDDAAPMSGPVDLALILEAQYRVTPRSWYANVGPRKSARPTYATQHLATNAVVPKARHFHLDTVRDIVTLTGFALAIGFAAWALSAVEWAW